MNPNLITLTPDALTAINTMTDPASAHTKVLAVACGAHHIVLMRGARAAGLLIAEPRAGVTTISSYKEQGAAAGIVDQEARPFANESIGECLFSSVEEPMKGMNYEPALSNQ